VALQGIITIEDIIEELVGEIWDEHDKIVEPVKKNNDGSFIVLGGVNFKDMLKEIEYGQTENDEEDDIPKEEPPEAPDTTIANWIMENLGRLPQVNEILTWQNLTITVLKVIKQRVMEVKISIGDI